MQTTIFRTGNDPGSIQHLDMLDNDIDIQALIEQYESKFNQVVLSPKKSKQKEYKFTKDAI